MQAQAATAEIIPFPHRARVDPPETESPHDAAQDRLTKALAQLDAALLEQKVAIAAWRASLGELKTSVQGIGLGLTQYQTSLDRLAADMTAANEEAKAMESWADAILADAAHGLAEPN